MKKVFIDKVTSGPGWERHYYPGMPDTWFVGYVENGYNEGSVRRAYFDKFDAQFLDTGGRRMFDHFLSAVRFALTGK